MFDVESTFGISQIALGILLALGGFGLVYMGKFNKKQNNALSVVGIIGVALVLLTPGLLVGTDTVTTDPLDTSVSWITANAEASAYITEPEPNSFLVQFEYDQTLAGYNNDSEWCNITGTVSRADTGSDPAFTTCQVGTIGTYTAKTATWGQRDVIERNSDSTFNYIWTDSNSVTHSGVDMTIPRLDTMRTDSFSLSVRPDQIIPDDMSLYDTMTATFIVGGETITITWMPVLFDNVGATASSA